MELGQQRDAPQSADGLLAHASPIPGSTVPDTVPGQYQQVSRDNPMRVRDVPLDRFRARVVDGSDNDLDFMPVILRPIPSCCLVVLYVSVAVSIVVLWVESNNNRQYELSSENVRMISRYFPALVGTITVLLFRSTIREFIRMTPYVAMADQKGVQNLGAKPSDTVSGAFFPWQNFFATPGITSFISLICQFTASFTVSLKVALLASTQNGDRWTLTVRFYPAVVLVGGYVLMALYTVFVAFKLRGKSTGLKWDPVSIADYVSLFAHCNALEYFEPLELRHEDSAKDILPSQRLFRLGYWDKVPQDGIPRKRVYGIGLTYSADDDGPPARMRSQKYKKKKEPLPIAEHTNTGPCANGTWPKCEHYPYRHNPGCARWVICLFTVVVWSTLGLSIYALVKGIAFNGFQLANTWSPPWNVSLELGDKMWKAPPVDPTDPKSTLLVYALLFRSLPTYVAGIFTSTIIDWVDLNMRFLQPFTNMFEAHKLDEEPRDPTRPEYKEHLGDASETVLLAYITLSPFQVPVTALQNGHYMVAFYSTLNTISPLFPVFVGGLLTLTSGKDKEDMVHFKFSLSAYIGIILFLLVYALALPSALPLPNRLLPRQFYSQADLMAMCHEARFLGSANLDIADRKHTPTKEHMTARILLSGARFMFGTYQGRSGGLHLGFDVRGTRKDDYGEFEDDGLVKWIRPEGFGEALRVTTERASTVMMTGALGGHGQYAPIPRQDHFARMAWQAHATDQQQDEQHEMRNIATATGRQRAGEDGAERRAVNFQASP